MTEMFAGYLDHFLWRGRALIAGRYDDLAAHYCLPLPVDLGGLSMDIQTADDLILALHRHRVALREAGITRLQPRILATDLPSWGNRVWVEWTGYGDGIEGDFRAQVCYRMDRSDGWLRIASMSYDRLMLPDFARASSHRRLIRSRA